MCQTVASCEAADGPAAPAPNPSVASWTSTEMFSNVLWDASRSSSSLS